MRLWSFNRRRKNSSDCADLDAAEWEAARALTDAKHLTARGERIGDQIRATGRRNHFGEAVAKALRGEA